MNRYSIYYTESQTHKAFGFRAGIPIAAHGNFYSTNDYYCRETTDNKINDMKQEDICKLKQFLKLKILYKEMSEGTADSIIEFCNEYLKNENNV